MENRPGTPEPPLRIPKRKRPKKRLYRIGPYGERTPATIWDRLVRALFN